LVTCKLNCGAKHRQRHTGANADGERMASGEALGSSWRPQTTERPIHTPEGTLEPVTEDDHGRSLWSARREVDAVTSVTLPPPQICLAAVQLQLKEGELVDRSATT
jgi:hypothetical protein